MNAGTIPHLWLPGAFDLVFHMCKSVRAAMATTRAQRAAQARKPLSQSSLSHSFQLCGLCESNFLILSTLEYIRVEKGKGSNMRDTVTGQKVVFPHHRRRHQVLGDRVAQRGSGSSACTVILLPPVSVSL